MKAYLREFLERIAVLLIGWLIDVFLVDKLDWLEKQIQDLPELQGGYQTRAARGLREGSDDQ